MLVCFMIFSNVNYVAYTATTPLLLSKNCLRSNLRASNVLGSMPPDPPSLALLYIHTYTTDIHVTWLQA